MLSVEGSNNGIVQRVPNDYVNKIIEEDEER